MARLTIAMRTIVNLPHSAAAQGKSLLDRRANRGELFILSCY